MDRSEDCCGKERAEGDLLRLFKRVGWLPIVGKALKHLSSQPHSGLSALLRAHDVQRQWLHALSIQISKAERAETEPSQYTSKEKE